ncbi:MAG: penicillin binding protein PBP4B [Coriobacteriales bacterium]|nr:penicillin binding protein PBP4B [Coriobacteriales bacterium]
MPRKKLSLTLILAAVLSLLVLPACTNAANADKSAAAGAAAKKVAAQKIDAVPDGGWQYELSFPDWQDPTRTSWLAINNTFSFEGRHDQGHFYLTLDKAVKSLKLFVNGVELDTSELHGSGSWRVDFSGVAIDGRNTLQLTEITPSDLKDAVKVYIPYPEVLDGTLEESGIAAESIALVNDLISADIEHGFTSAQLAVVRHGKLVYENAWGKTNSYLPDGSPDEKSPSVTTDTLYDLASVTKMFGTNYALQKLLTEERLSLDDPISKYLGDRFYKDVIDIKYAKGANPPLETQQAWKASLTIRDLLYHQGGFPPDVGYAEPNWNPETSDTDPNVENVLYSGADGSAKTREATIEAICKTPLLYEPRSQTKYSDLDFMILGAIVEKISGKDLDSYLKENFTEPMGLKHITFNPLEHGFTAQDCAATEVNGNTREGAIDFPGIRTKTIQGQVHDELSWYCMGGISGHAGLFSNASDLAKLASTMLTGGYGEHRFFSRNAIELFSSPKSIDYSEWAMGWWRNGDNQRPWYFGTQSSANVIGHQGWTGTMVMIDPDRDLVIVFLTNKINSMVTDVVADPNTFDGNWYTTSTLGFVSQILSIGLDSDQDVMPQLRSLAQDMANESQKLIPEGAAQDHPAVKNAQSKEAVAKEWAKK